MDTDPRAKDGTDQEVPLLNLTGYDAREIMLQRRIITRGWGRVFPYNHRSVSAAFTRACDELKIEDLRFHDLRHEGTSRLFEAGLTIEKIALVAGHSRKLVRRVIRGERNDVFRTRQSSLDLRLPWLDDQWASGCRNGPASAPLLSFDDTSSSHIAMRSTTLSGDRPCKQGGC